MGKLKTYWINNKLNISVQLVGHIFFAVYLLLALVFYKERTIFIDCADFSFEMIQKKTFVLPFGRWGSFFTQILPLLALKMGASLSVFLKVYSLSIAFFYYLVYLIVVFVFKSNRLTIIYLLTLCLTFRNTFYFSISELAQGLALCVVVYGLLKELVKEEGNYKWIKTIITMVIIGSLYYFHQLLLFAIMFAIITVIINFQAYKNKHVLSVLFFTVLWFGIKILLLSSDGYEGQKIPEIAVFKEQIPHLFQLPSFNYFVDFARIEMWFSLTAVIIALGLLMIRKQFLLVIFFITYCLAYLILIVITYYLGEAPNMYEQYYILFGFFIALILDITRKNKIGLTYLIIVCIPLIFLSTNRMFLAHKKPTKRIVYLENLVEKGAQFENRKFLLHPHDFPWDYAWVTWGLPMETILISSLNGKNNTVTIFVPAHGWEATQQLEEDWLHAPSWLRYEVRHRNLDSSYFLLPQKDYLFLKGRVQADF